MIGTGERSGAPLGRVGRVLLGAWGLLLLWGFAVACGLEPAPEGFGTHQRLGLPPCTFRARLGITCPSCGMTTSFANFVRGEFVAAARANAAGLLLAVLCAVQVPWAWASAWTGRLCGVRHPDVLLAWLLVGFAVVCALNWLVRLLWLE